MSLLDDIYCAVLKRISDYRKWSNNLEQEISPMAIKKLEKFKEQSRIWEAIDSGYGLWSVKHGTEAFIVDFNGNEYSYSTWQLSGIPCPYVVAMMRDLKQDPLPLVHACYKTSNLKRTYSYTLKPLHGQDEWETAPGEAVVVKKKGLSFKRRPEEGEPAAQFGRVRKSGKDMHCSRCGKAGHKKATCNERVPKLKVKRS